MSYIAYLGELDSKFRILDELPDSLYSSIVTHSHGVLEDRIKGILQWRDAFLQGQLPEEKRLVWPEPDIRRMVLKRIEVLDIVKYCRDQIDLTDSVLLDVCEAISSAEHWQKIDPGFDDQLARQQKRRDILSPFEDSSSPFEDSSSPFEDSSSTIEDSSLTVEDSTNNLPHNQLDDTSNNQDVNNDEQRIEDSSNSTESFESLGSMDETPLDTQQDIDNENILSDHAIDVEQNPVVTNEQQAFNLGDTVLEKNWLELAKQWNELESVFSELSGFLGKGWDLTQGLLASQGWRDVIRYRQLVRELPWLERIIASLGRLKDLNKEQQTIEEAIFEPVKRVIEEEVPVRTPQVVYETSGVRRSDDISRLLPGELAQLGHPQLNLLWHAKRAEHTLLTYHIDGVLSEHEPVEQEEFVETIQRQDEVEKGFGPIIICLDSSASMQGKPEYIAKALVLEALRIAWHENRACYVYLFSGPEQVIQHNLDLTQGGLAQLLAFLTQTFHGGTDVISPLMQALDKQSQKNWQEADILLVSDGRFPVSTQQKLQVKKVRTESDCRIHGVVIGQWQGSAMQTVCDHFHRVSVE